MTSSAGFWLVGAVSVDIDGRILMCVVIVGFGAWAAKCSFKCAALLENVCFLGRSDSDPFS